MKVHRHYSKMYRHNRDVRCDCKYCTAQREAMKSARDVATERYKKGKDL